MALAIRCYARFTSFGLGFIHVRRAGEFATASGSCVVVNVASNEYSAVLPRSEIPEGFTWVDCVFKDSGRILSVYGNFDIILTHRGIALGDGGVAWRGVVWCGAVRCGGGRWEVKGEGGRVVWCAASSTLFWTLFHTRFAAPHRPNRAVSCTRSLLFFIFQRYCETPLESIFPNSSMIFENEYLKFFNYL